jgi:predicted O-methyltransferase YrrM
MIKEAAAGTRFGFCPVLDEMAHSGKLVGRSGRQFDQLSALSSNNNLITLRQLHLSLKPKRTLEIGLSFGGSCLIFTASHQELHGRPSRQHTALDPFQSEVWDEAGLLAVERAGLSEYLDFRPAFSSLMLPQLVEQRGQFDLIYVDGSHLFEDVFVDAYYTARLLSEGGVVAFDDCGDPNVLKVIQFLRRNMQDSLAEMDLSPFRADAGKPIKYRLARMMKRTQMTAFCRIGNVSREWNAPFCDF